MQRHLLPSNPAFPAVVATVQEVGCQGSLPGADHGDSGFRAVAYFNALVRGDGSLAIQFAEALPRQMW